jgi:predicted nucleic acid-binding protein
VGLIEIPSEGSVYLDTNCVIYSVEKIEPYCGVLASVWSAANAGQIQIACSELVLVEALVKPVREGDSLSEQLYRELLTCSGEISLLPITREVLERTILVRAQHGLRTPDAIHAATAIETGCTLLLSNDPAFQRLPDLRVSTLAGQQ